MKPLNSSFTNVLSLALVGTAALTLSASLLAAPAKPKGTAKASAKKAAPKPKAPVKTNVPAIFYDETWSYRTGTLYDEKKNIVSSVSGEAKFKRDGKFEQNYYIGSIGNFFKGTYKIKGDHLITYDEKGKEIFDFKFTVGTEPKVLVLTLLNDDGSKSMDFSLVPLEKKKTQ